MRRGSGPAVAWSDKTTLLTSSEVRGIRWVKHVGIWGGGMVAGVKEEMKSFTFWVK